MNHDTLCEFLPEDYFTNLNELLKGCTELGAYAMGLVTVLAENANLKPDRRLLYNASKATSIQAAGIIFEAWAREKKS